MEEKIEQGPHDSREKFMIPDSEIEAQPSQFPRGGKIRRIRIFVSLAFAVMLLSGGVWFLSRSNADASLVGKVNGEGITRKELTARVDQFKKFHEKQNGQELFKGREGDEILARNEQPRRKRTGYPGELLFGSPQAAGN